VLSEKRRVISAEKRLQEKGHKKREDGTREENGYKRKGYKRREEIKIGENRL